MWRMIVECLDYPVCRRGLHRNEGQRRRKTNITPKMYIWTLHYWTRFLALGYEGEELPQMIHSVLVCLRSSSWGIINVLRSIYVENQTRTNQP